MLEEDGAGEVWRSYFHVKSGEYRWFGLLGESAM